MEARVPRVSECVSAAVLGGTEGPGPVTCARSLRRRRRRRGRAALQTPALDHQRRAPSPCPPARPSPLDSAAPAHGNEEAPPEPTAAPRRGRSGQVATRVLPRRAGAAPPRAGPPSRPRPGLPAPPRAQPRRAVPRSSAPPKLSLGWQLCGHGLDHGTTARPPAPENKGARKPTGNFSRAVLTGAISADSSFGGGVCLSARLQGEGEKRIVSFLSVSVMTGAAPGPRPPAPAAALHRRPGAQGTLPP